MTSLLLVAALLLLPSIPETGQGGLSHDQLSTQDLNFSAGGNASGAAGLPPTPPPLPPVASRFGAWPTYDQGNFRQGAQLLERTLSAANASGLTLIANLSTLGPAEGSMAAVPGPAGTGRGFYGDWAGDVYALNLSTVPSTNITYWVDSPVLTPGWVPTRATFNCGPGTSSYPVAGVTGTPAVDGSNVFVVDQGILYDLNERTGAILWSENVTTAGNQTPHVSNGNWKAHYIWSSPLAYGSYVYVGMSSGCDTPLIQGQLLQFPINGTNHSVVHIVNVTPAQAQGGSIWSTPSIDPSSNTVWITTGNMNGSLSRNLYPFAQAFVALNATNISRVKGYYTDLNQCKNRDCDFGAGPMLFSDSNGTAMVGALSKDGNFYAFNRSAFFANGTQVTNVSKPRWSDTTNTRFSISPAAYSGTYLYVGGGATTINGVSYNGSVREIYPSNGTVHKAVGTTGYVLAGITYSNGLVIDSAVNLPGVRAGSTLEVRDASSLAPLYSYKSGLQMNAEPIVFDGRIYVTSAPSSYQGPGSLYVFGLTPVDGASILGPAMSALIGSASTAAGTAIPAGGMPTYNFTWMWGDNSSNSFGISPNHDYTFSGTVTASLSMTDSAGMTGLTKWSVNTQVLRRCPSQFVAICWTLTATHCVPAVWIGAARCFGLSSSPSTSYFGAYAQNGTGALSWAWTFGDGSSPSTLEFPSHTYASHGTYTVTVTVTDADNHISHYSYQLLV
jgi:hypothetical protein